MIHINWTSGNRRRFILYGMIWLTVLILIGGFYNLQIMQENIYREKSLQNSVKVETQIPIRGLIYDRDGRLIADNRPSFSIYLVPALTTESTIETVSNVLGIDRSAVTQKFRRSRRFQPVKIARYVDRTQLTVLQENKSDLPGLEWKVEPMRHYEFSSSYAHVLGTIGEITESELQRDKDYEPGDLVGKAGIEKVLDKHLRGSKGFKYVKVDALGRTVESLESDKNARPHPGNDLYLTLDSRLQSLADSLFTGRNGALVAINPQNGEILTLLSKPDYDLNLFSEAVDPVVWRALNTDSLKPLYDRACQATYPPGSTYKMVAAIAALNENIVSPHWSVFCPGYYVIGRRTIRCWNAAGHGDVNVHSALQYSCNVYFYQLGLKIGIDHWSNYSRIFAFGTPTGLEVTSEKGGLVPSKTYYDRVYGENGWTKGMLANIAIGQGELLVTPVQMAQFAMILANNGKYYQPHLTRKLHDKISEEETRQTYPASHIEGIDSNVFSAIRAGMVDVVNSGTGTLAGVWGIPGAGKTGTAQNPHGDSHAWYIGFTPVDTPEVAIAVVVENGGGGGAVAAPIAGEYLRRYFHHKGEFDYKLWREWRIKMWRLQQEKARQDSLREAGAIIDSLEIRN